MARLIAVLVLVGSCVAPAAAQMQADRYISITAGAVERGGFIPRSTPYVEGGPAVSVFLFDQRNVRTGDGLIITGFDFIGWAEDDGTRVQVFALVPRKGAPNTYMPNGDADLLERRDFASYRILRDQGVPVAAMRGLGLEPMILHARPVPAQVAQLERVRELMERLQASSSNFLKVNVSPK